MRISVGPGTPELYAELAGLEDSARCERVKHLASIALIYLSRGQPPVRGAQAAEPALTPAPAENDLSGVVRRLRMSLDEDPAETSNQ